MDYRKFLGLPLLLLLIFCPLSLSYSEDYTPLEIEIKLYNDGVSHVTLIVESDPTKAEVEVTLYGQNITDVLVVNQSNLPLEFNTTSEGIKVTALGSTSMNVTYFSDSYISKIGDVWTFNFTASATANVILPSGASLLSTSIIPLDIQTLNGQLHIVFPDDVFSINYTLSEVGPSNGDKNGSGFDLAFYYLIGIYVVLFAIIVYAYHRLGNR